MPSLETTDWLALKARVDTLVTSPAMLRFDPGEVITPPVHTEGEGPSPNEEGQDNHGLPMPFLLLSDVTNEPQRMGISGVDHVRSGTLMITVQWPITRPVSHVQLKEIGGQIAAHFPADTCMSFGPSRLRVTQDAAAMSAYVDGAYRVLPVRVLWSSM